MPSKKSLGFVPIPLIILGAIILFVFIKFYSPKPNPTPLVSSEPSNAVKIATNSASFNPDKVQKYLTVEAALLGVTDNVSYYLKDLSDDKDISLNSTRSWIPASTIKAYVVPEAFRQARLGLINLNQKVTIDASNIVPTELETNDYPVLNEGITVTINQLLEMMVTQSDNTAYNTLLDILDRRNINKTLSSYGLTETVVGEKLNLDDNQFQNDLQVAGRQPNTTTVKDYVALFDLLYNKKIPESDQILEIFKKQKINNMIPAFLPKDTSVAHKTGDWAPIFHDGGVIYKPDQPFILAVFSNSNDPAIISKLARVAYFQTADSVTTNDGTPQKQTLDRRDSPIYLASDSKLNQILGETTGQKFPEITAADLGITSQDLNTSQENAHRISPAIINPGSVLYDIKKYIEQLQINLSLGSDQKVDSYLNRSTSRLAEIKHAANIGDANAIGQLLDESENDLKSAAQQSKLASDQDPLLTQIKQVNDLHYATLAEASNSLTGSDKEKFIDVVYNFYTKNQSEIKPVVAKSVIADPINQKPAIGSITKIDNNIATVQFDDGQTKDVILDKTTPIRDFSQTNAANPNELSKGSKIAVIGKLGEDGKIIPEFILNKVPKELPNEHVGTVIEIDPKEKMLKIKDSFGNLFNIVVSDATIVKSSNTSVSLEGIQAGSNVAIFGQNATSSATTSTNPNDKTNPLPSQSPNQLIPTSSQAPSPNPQGSVQPKNQSPQPNSQGDQKSQNPTIPTISATSVTVVKNSSGQNSTSKPAPPNPPPANNPGKNSGAGSTPSDKATPAVTPNKPPEKKPADPGKKK